MALYVYVEEQTVEANNNALLNDSIPCPNGYVLHRNGSGLLTLRGVTNGCNKFARYEIIANGNMAIPTGGEVGAISMAIAQNGEEIPSSLAIVTPAAVENFFNFTCSTIIDVYKGCCPSVALENSSDQDIIVQNLNVNVKRIA